jgi:hypothetical protein
VEGLTPDEASDRLQSFQAQFNELWRKYVTYSGGEELFGLSVNGDYSHIYIHIEIHCFLDPYFAYPWTSKHFQWRFRTRLIWLISLINIISRSSEN